MKRLRFLVLRLPVFAADTSVEMYGDLGSGAIDYTKPLPPGRVRLWPAASGRMGHLFDAHLTVGHLDNVFEDGHLTGGHLLDGHLTPALAIVFHSPRYGLGRFRHGFRLLDGSGNGSAEGAMEFAHTVNEAPDVPRSMRRSGWVAASKQVRFALAPVRFAAVAGA